MNKIYIGLSILLIIIIYIYYISNEFLNNNNNNTKYKQENKFISLLNSTYNNNFPKLIFIPHFELGDSIVVNGIIRYYCSIYHTVFMPCKSNYYNQIKFMYSDISNLVLYNISDKKIYHNIKLYIPYDKNDIELYHNYNIEFKVLGCMKSLYNIPSENIPSENIKSENTTSDFPIWIYDDLKLPNVAYEYFKITRNYTRENELYNNLINIIGKKYVIIIDDEKRNFVINPKFLSHIKYPIFKMGYDSNNIIPELNSIRDPIVFNNIKILENAMEIISIDSSIPWIIDFLNINVKTSVHTYMRDGHITYKNKNIKIILGTFIDRLSAYFNIFTYNSKMCNIFI